MLGHLRVTGNDGEWSPKYYGVIVGLFCGLYMISIAIGSKLIDVHGLVLPAGIIIFPFCCIITDILTEIYGFNRTRQAVWTALLCTVLFATFTQLAIALPPAGFWPNQQAFESVFATSLRLAAAGCFAWVAGEFSNSFIMSKMKIFQGAKNMPLRFVGSTVIGQFLDTIVFVTIAFAGTMPWPQFFLMMLTGWAVKVLYEIVALPVSIPVANFIKRLEGVEHFDRQKLSLV